MDISQEEMRLARTSGSYDKIWQSRDKCVFCDLKDKYIIREENGIVLTVSLYPYIDGHMMAIPRRHVQSPKELSSLEWETIRKFNYIAKKLIRKAHGHKSMWTLLREGGAKADMSVADHLHVHYIPFDNADLSVWNYRDLKHTPLENASIYQGLLSNTEKAATKFSQKYSYQGLLPLVVSAVIINKSNEVLLQRRTPYYHIEGKDLVIPGGHVEINTGDFRDELARELEEELAVKAPVAELKLVDSQLQELKFSISYNQTSTEKLIWNVYLWRTKLAKSAFKHNTGESAELHWVKLTDVADRLGDNRDLSAIIAKAAKQK